MYNIDFYETADGSSDIRDFLESLRSKADTVKEARIQYKQAARAIQLLQDNGTNLPVEIAKHLEDEIWELRPGNNRIFFFYYHAGTYVLLHHYRKKVKKLLREKYFGQKKKKMTISHKRRVKNELERI